MRAIGILRSYMNRYSRRDAGFGGNAPFVRGLCIPRLSRLLYCTLLDPLRSTLTRTPSSGRSVIDGTGTTGRFVIATNLKR